MPYSEIFGGNTIYPAQQSYLSLVISANTPLAWPIEQQVGGNVVADIIDISAGSPGLNVDIPDARQVSNGFTALFNNVGANTVTIRDAAGGTIVSLASGTVWQVYLRDNSTLAGLWRVFQYGASVSVTNAAALAGSGLKAIATTLNQSVPVIATSATPFTIIDSHRAQVIQWTGGVGTFNLAAAGTVGADWFFHVKNAGTGDLTLTPPAGTIDGSATKAIAAGVGAIVYTDGTNYFTIGATTSGGGGAFDFVSIAVPGTGTFALSGANLNRIAYRFTGILTGTRTIEVPGAIQQYWIDNATTGAFSLFVKTAAQAPPGVEVVQGNKAILYCDGTNVVDADTGTFTPPLAVSLGGTGSNTAAGARINLGATATGDSLFTAASGAAALATIGGVPTARILTAGLGLVGGGDLTADRTFDVNPGLGLALSGDTVVLSHLGIQNLVDPNADRIMFWDDSAGFTDWLAPDVSLLIAGTALGVNRTYKFKTSNTVRASTVTLTDDPDLSAFTLAVGTWRYQGLIWPSSASATPDFKSTFQVASGSIQTTRSKGIQMGDASGVQNVQGESITQVITWQVPGTSAPISIYLEGVVEVSTAAVLDFQWAQNTSDASATTLEAGSFIEFYRVL